MGNRQAQLDRLEWPSRSLVVPGVEVVRHPVNRW